MRILKMGSGSFGVFIVLFILIACVARGPMFENLQTPPGNKALLYIYRVGYDKYRNDLAPDITVNGQEVGTLWLDGYLVAVVDPGAVLVKMENKMYGWPKGAPLRFVSLNIAPNKTGFVEFSIDDVERVEVGSRSAIDYMTISFSEMPERVAMKFLPKLKRINSPAK